MEFFQISQGHMSESFKVDFLIEKAKSTNISFFTSYCLGIVCNRISIGESGLLSSELHRFMSVNAIILIYFRTFVPEDKF